MAGKNLKQKTTFFCSECGHESSKWLGQCPACKAWNSFVEAPTAKKGDHAKGVGAGSPRAGFVGKTRVTKLSEVETRTEERLSTSIGELDRVLGGGIVRGSLVLVGGDPGIGKSTLLLQMARNLAAQGVRVLYVSGEESLRQIRMRAERLGEFPSDIDLLCETDMERIDEAIGDTRPQVLIIDSIQTMFTESIDAAPGSVSQVREVTTMLLRITKTDGISCFIVGHVTKEGTVAGPRTLEHMVDTVLYFEGENVESYRILRAAKNRFGSTNEVGVFDMRQEGLAEVPNPSAYMLAGMPEHAAGSIVACTVEGSRPIMVEVQALVCPTNFNMPRRTAAGTDYNRVNLLIAVLEKRLGLNLGSCDAYVNIAGGMRVNEPALDLAIVAALISSYKNQDKGDKIICFGEVGLTGEVRGISQARQRVEEAARMGMPVCIMPKVNMKGLPEIADMQIIGIRNVRELLNLI